MGKWILVYNMINKNRSITFYVLNILEGFTHSYLHGNMHCHTQIFHLLFGTTKLQVDTHLQYDAQNRSATFYVQHILEEFTHSYLYSNMHYNAHIRHFLFENEPVNLGFTRTHYKYMYSIISMQRMEAESYYPSNTQNAQSN